MSSLKSKLWPPLVFLVSTEASGQNFREEEEEEKGEVSRKREREANNDDSSLKEDQVNIDKEHIPNNSLVLVKFY